MKRQYELKEEERMAKNEEMNQKKVYRDILNNQAQMNQLNKNNFGKMTQQEKKLNKVDLGHFKTKEFQQINALIPGLNNISGVAGPQPFNRGAVKAMIYADEAELKAERKKGQIFFSPQQTT